MLLEQPVVRDDLDSMAAIRSETGIPVAEDESVRSLVDAQEVVARGAADYINIKIMKTGVVEAREIASFTKTSGLKLMIGGMVETRVAIGCSFSLVLGLGGFEVLDLDTPLLLATDPVTGGRPTPATLVNTGPRHDRTTVQEHHYHRIDDAVASSHFLQFNVSPRCWLRPTSVRTQGRFVIGGWWRTCCPWPH